jgi:predicted nucleic acid-binding protein
MKPADKVVLDSFALLAFLADEPGADKVSEIFEHGRRHAGSVWMSVINLGECLYIIERERGLAAAHRAIAAVRQLPVTEAGADRERTFNAAHIKAHHKLSFADAFAVALAQEKSASVVTGDPEFAQVESLVPVLWLPR